MREMESNSLVNTSSVSFNLYLLLCIFMAWTMKKTRTLVTSTLL